MLKTKLTLCASAVAMLTLTSCCSNFRAEPVLQGGYLNLQKGQEFRAPKDCTLVDLEIVEAKDAQILSLIEALRKDSVNRAIE